MASIVIFSTFGSFWSIAIDVQFSSFRSMSVLAMWMYLSDIVAVLCPSFVLTSRLSCRSVNIFVSPQCRKVWKCICISRGFWSLIAVRFLMCSNVMRSPCADDVAQKIGLLVCGSVWSISISLGDTGSSLGRLPFSGWLIATVFPSVSRSFHSTLVASPILLSVSFRNWRSGAIVLPAEFMSASISSSRGMKMIFSSALYFGLFHVFPMNFKYPS